MNQVYEIEDIVGLGRGKLCIIGVNYNKASSIMIYLQTPYVTKTFANCDDNPDMLIFNRLFYPFPLARGKGHISDTFQKNMVHSSTYSLG